MKTLKSLILVLVFSIGSIATINAAPVAEIATEQEPKQDQNQKEVEMKDLPTHVQKDMKQKYPDAEFVRAYKTTSADGSKTQQYVVVVNNAGQETRLTYDAEGKAVK